MSADERVFWRSETCTAGSLVFRGDESAFMGTPGDSYEYWITVAPDQFDLLRRTLGAGPAADVVELVCERVDDIMARGERTWLDDHGIERGFGSYYCRGPWPCPEHCAQSRRCPA